MTKPTQEKIVITDRFCIEARSFLQSQKRYEVVTSKTPYPTAEELKGCVGLIIRSRTSIDTKLLERASDLKVIVTATSGFDHIDLDLTQKHGVTTMYTPSGNATSAAELTLLLMLSACRKAPQAHQMVQQGSWERVPLIGNELKGKSLGLIGLGRVGSNVAQIAKGFGLVVSAFDPFAPPQRFEDLDVGCVGLMELLRSSDIISLHVPYTKQTHHLLNKSTLSEVSTNVLIVNTSRGSVVCEQDLIQCLTQHRSMKAALDVFEREPLDPSSPLLSLANVVLTPHIGATTEEAFQLVSWDASRQLVEFLENGKIENALPPLEPWYQSLKNAPGTSTWS